MHLDILNLSAMKIKNIEVVFLPLNTISLLQRLDQSIVQFVKVTYTCLVFNYIDQQLIQSLTWTKNTGNHSVLLTQ